MKRNALWILAIILFSGLVITSCSNEDGTDIPSEEIEARLRQMILKLRMSMKR